MKSIKFVAIVAVILVPMLFSCGKSDKQSNVEGAGSTEQVSTPASLDVEKIMTYKDADDPSKLSEKDYDFLLGQMEILIDEANKLPADQAKDYIQTLDKEHQDAALVVAVILASADQSTWTDKQKKRFQEMAEKDPSKK